MSLDELKRKIQQHFEAGLVVIVGSGLSIAEGIPGMSGLEAHLNANVPDFIDGETSVVKESWKKISDLLASKKGLETALQLIDPPKRLEQAIIHLTYNFLKDAEASVLKNVMSGKRILAFSRLLPHLNPEPRKALPVITTNYDRLIEVATEHEEWGVDSLFIGNHFGKLNPVLSYKSFISNIASKTKKLVFRNRIILSKPHGSLDWYEHKNGPVRSSIHLDLDPLIVTPGGRKYFKGYSPPFDTHREYANRAIDNASRYLILGYGFNDDHLETHLNHELKKGKPALVITHGLTDNAKLIMNEADGFFSITANPKDGNKGFVYSNNKSVEKFDGKPLWQLDILIDEVLGG